MRFIVNLKHNLQINRMLSIELKLLKVLKKNLDDETLSSTEKKEMGDKAIKIIHELTELHNEMKSNYKEMENKQMKVSIIKIINKILGGVFIAIIVTAIIISVILKDFSIMLMWILILLQELEIINLRRKNV